MNEGEIAGIPGQDDENNTKGSVVRLRLDFSHYITKL